MLGCELDSSDIGYVDHWRTYMKTAWNFVFHKMRGNSWLAE
jgi:hypothetical protein